MNEDKEHMENKIKVLDDKIKLLEGNDLNVSKIVDLNTSKDIVEENIRRSRIKEIKLNKELLEKRLFSLEEQVHNMIEEEDKENKKFNVKQFLDNFEKDKKGAEARAKKWEKERNDRMKNLENQQILIQEKIKQKLDKTEKEIKEKENKLKEEYYRNLEKFKENSKKKREEIGNLKEEWQNKETVEKQYRYEILEAKFKKKQEQLKEEEKIKLQEYIEKKKNYLKPISKEELNDFQHKYEEGRQRLIYEKEKERLIKQEEILNNNFNLPKQDSKAYYKMIEQEKKQKELKEKEKLDKIYNSMKIKQFSEVVHSTMLPRIDEDKKAELKQRIKGLTAKCNPEEIKKRSKSKKKKKKTRILLKKRNPESKAKYKWDLKLNSSDDNMHKERNTRRSNSGHLRKFNESISPIKDHNNDERHTNLTKSRSKSAERRKPLEKLPNYLHEFRAKKINPLSNANLVHNKGKTKLN
jgi:hypothetical protein